MFKVGDTVKCISIAKSIDPYAQLDRLKRGTKYKVQAVQDHGDGLVYIHLGGMYWQCASRFVKVKGKSHLPGWW